MFLSAHGRRPSNRQLALLLSLTLLSSGLTPASRRSAARGKWAPRPANAQAQSDTTSIRVLNLATRDLVYDSHTQMIYASVPSRAGSAGNSITAIDPMTGTVGSSVFIGSEPGKLSLTDNGQYIYAALDGSASVGRYDIASRTVGSQFTLGVNGLGPDKALGLTAIPGSPQSVAVSNTRLGVMTYTIYDDGVPRPSSPTVFNGGSSVLSSANGSTLYSLGFESGSGYLTKMAVSSSGLTPVSTKQVGGYGAYVKIDGGLLYTSAGHVLDPEAGRLLGTFTAPDLHFHCPVAPDSSVGRVYFLTGFPNDYYPGGGTFNLILRAFDQTTFLQVGAITISGVTGVPISLIRWGANGLAFGTNQGQVYVIQTSLIPSSVPVPSPTPTPAPTPAATPWPTPISVKQISITTRDIILDPNTQTIYASVPGSAVSDGNSIIPINPATGALGAAVPIGLDPGKLEISDNGAYLYVALGGTPAVRRFDIRTQTAGMQFALGSDPIRGPMYASDLAVIPGSPESVAVSRRLPDFNYAGVAIYDNGVQRPVTASGFEGSNIIRFSASPSVLYGLNAQTTGWGFYKNAVGPCGASVYNVTNGLLAKFQSDFRIDNGLVYIPDGSIDLNVGANFLGRVYDPETNTIIGSFTSSDSGLYSLLMTPDSKTGRVYFLLSTYLRVTLLAYDMRTFLPLGSETISGLTGIQPSRLIRWGAKGLAFRTDDQVYLIESSLVPDNAQAPTPRALPATPRYSVGGQVVDSSNHGVAGFTVTLTGSQAVTTQTDAEGNYLIGNLDQCGTYTLTASSPGYLIPQGSLTFTPGNSTLDFRNGNLIVNFIASTQTAQFSGGSYSVGEGDGSATITITRTGDSSGTATVDYATADGTAGQRTKYITASGTLSFGPGETSKTFNVLIIDEAYVEGNKTINLILTNPTGGLILGSLAEATLTIIDNDSADPVNNPIDDSLFFVHQHYLDFLSRAPDQKGLSYWTSQISGCGNDQGCILRRRVGVSAAYFTSQEFQDTGFFVYLLYKASFGQKPTYAQFMPDRSRVVGGASLDAGKAQFVAQWVQRADFLQQYPRALAGDQFVDKLIQGVKAANGVDLTSQRSALLGLYDGTDNGRAAILRAVVDNASVKAAEYNAAFVLMQYFGYLRRDPDADGYNFWLKVMNGLDKSAFEGMTCAFITSREYQERFSPVVTHSNADCGR